MSEGGGGVLGVGGSEGFLWESQPWAVSNSDDTGGSDDHKSHQLTLASKSTDSLQTRIGVDTSANKKMQKGKKRDRNEGSEGMNEGRGVGEQDEHEMHIWTERERRKKMRNMFANLHALLPQLPPKVN
ncbi:hypothetical protein Ancab_028245 [Ancistrocladus abbreviatus]